MLRLHVMCVQMGHDSRFCRSLAGDIAQIKLHLTVHCSLLLFVYLLVRTFLFSCLSFFLSFWEPMWIRLIRWANKSITLRKMKTEIGRGWKKCPEYKRKKENRREQQRHKELPSPLSPKPICSEVLLGPQKRKVCPHKKTFSDTPRFPENAARWEA